MNYLIVFGGAGLGGALRHGVNVAAMRLGFTAFPIGTLTVNILGSFLMGLIAEYFALKGHLPQSWRLFLTTGVLGGFTTFSAFSLEVALFLAAQPDGGGAPLRPEFGRSVRGCLVRRTLLRSPLVRT